MNFTKRYKIVECIKTWKICPKTLSSFREENVVDYSILLDLKKTHTRTEMCLLQWVKKYKICPKSRLSLLDKTRCINICGFGWFEFYTELCEGKKIKKRMLMTKSKQLTECSAW